MAEAGRIQNNEVPQERVDQTETYRQLAVREPSLREQTATRIARSVLVLFAGSLVGSFAVGAYLIYRSQGTVDHSSIEVSLSYLKSVGTLFTPLLGFILGYYFTKKED